MASLQASADSIRAAVQSTSTCTPTTATILSDLLLPKINVTVPVNSKGSAKSAALGRSKTTKAPPAKGGRKKVVCEDEAQENGEQLSTKERSILATEVINATLKALSEAIKAPASLPRKESSKDLVKASARKALRRSNSLPQSPLQPRSLNRVASSPNIPTRLSRSSSSASTTTSGHRSTAECARVAFACLRTLQAAKVPHIVLPPLQVENGMSVLIGKLIVLGLDDLAIKEIRILRRRLDAEEESQSKKSSLSKGSASAATPQTLAELLDFGKGAFTGSKLGLVITTQLQVLRLIASSRKHKNAEAALPILQPSHPSSPTRLLLLAAEESPKPDKFIRQLQQLSEILLSLSPSVSTTEDAIALESRLSVLPEVAIQLQSLALQNRAQWWSLAGHKGDSVKELSDPFLRCLSAFVRRSQCEALETWRISSSAFSNFQSILSTLGESQPGPKSILTGIYRLLGSVAQEANLIDEAIDWTRKVQGFLDPKVDSEARRCSVAARLVGLSLRRTSRQLKDEEPLLNLLDGLERPFKGDASEIDDLLTEVSATRRAAITILSQRNPTQERKGELTDGMREMCESLVLLCPRLYLRYLGNPLDVSSSTTKDIVRHEQRRQFIAKPGRHAIDSTLFLVKTFQSEGRLSWDLMDSKLQDCLFLLDRLDGVASLETGSSLPSYYVRISSLYYSQYLNMSRDAENPKDGQQIRVLRRATDCIRTRSREEKRQAFFSLKLERLADAYRFLGRYDEAFKILTSLRDEMIDNGALSVVTSAAATMPIQAAWTQGDETSRLARTLQSLVKFQFRYLTSVQHAALLDGPWSDDERAAMLEHLLEILSTQSSNRNSVLVLQTKVFQSLLSLYTRKEYPLRRLRVLIRLLYLATASSQEVVDDISLELDSLLFKDMDIEKSKDCGLRGYMVHLRALATSLLELQLDQPKVEILKQSLAVWSSIREACGNLATFESQVDDVRGLLSHLQSIADFTQVKGFDSIRLATLRLISDVNQLRDDSPNELILSFTRLGAQWLHLGYSGKAGLALDRAQVFSHQNGVMSPTLLQLHLSYAEYMLSIGSYDKSEEHLLRAHAISDEKDFDSRLPASLAERTSKNQLIANACLVHSMLALERGTPQTALTYAKQGVYFLRRAWKYTEEQNRRQNSPTESPLETAAEKLSDDISKLSMSAINISTTTANNQSFSGCTFWPLITPLFRGLSYLSSIYAHHGMFQETLFYAEQAHTLVKEVGSEAHTAIASAYLGSIWLKAATLDKGSEFLMAAKQLSRVGDKTRDTALLDYHLGNMHGLLGDRDAELAAYEEAETTLEGLSQLDFINTVDHLVDPADDLEKQMASLTVSKRKPAAPRKAGVRPKAAVLRKTMTRAKSPVEVAPSVAEECPQLLSLKGVVLRQKARALTLLKTSENAITLLNEADAYSNRQIDSVNQGLAMAKQLLLQSMEQMSADPVYSVLQESTISFPSVVGLTKTERGSGDRHSVTRLSPPRKRQVGKSARNQTRSRSPAPNSFFDKLRQAQESLTEVHSVALIVAPVAVIHTISALLNSVAILLSAAGQIKGKLLAHPGLASCSVETARTLALRRERKAIMADPSKLKMDDSCWPQFTSSDTRRASLGPMSDMARFQKDYIDIIPKSWTAISIALSDSRNELSLTKLQAGCSPFVLRLPLGRNNSIDADEEVFGFEQGHSELLEILDLANESAHNTREISGRDDKIAWWEEREALDARLRDLLENVEKVWLGGFTGIFSQHPKRSDLLARFQKSFQNVLDKHLPSRQKTGKRGGNPRITLDSRILDLFIGLGDASDEDCDFSEPLTDLLYFVVDILQFHGELNAYAEIDFDSIVVETHDALRAYHEAFRTSNSNDEARHTILILDKALHAFPWESLPCMNGLAVSRLPSLGCLRDRILEQQKDMPDDSPQGRYVTRDNGLYILNPEGDLKNTQASFEKPLQSLTEWNGIIKREPTEDEIKSELQSKDIFLYFGHGSGAQFIRAREIRKLEKCAVTVLMGCSSGALTEAGEFEPYGPPINYMHAGCPALVATLWDVTDKDIDRFAKSTFEHWGLFERQEEKVSRRGKGKKKVETAHVDKGMSLVEAVAKGREACNLRYLNGAAVCVYGVPVYFK